MERPDVSQTLTPPPGLQTLATATACFRAPSPVPPPQPQNLDTTATPSAVPESGLELSGLELSLNLPSQATGTGNLEHEFINFGDGGGDQIEIGSGMDVFSIFGDGGEASMQRGVDLFAIFGDEEEVATENVDAVMNSVEEVAKENADAVMNSVEEVAKENADAVMNSVEEVATETADAVMNFVEEAATENTDAFVNSVDGEGAVAGSRSDAFMLFGDEEGAAVGSGFDTAMLFGDDERAATETDMQAEGDTPLDGLNTIVDAENVGRADRLVVADSIGDAPNSSVTCRPEITNTRKKRRSMANLVIGTDLGMDGLGNEEGVAEMKQGKRNEVHDLGDADVAGMEVEGTVSTQRARKKSKYLSPPYTNPSWSDMQAALHGGAHALVPWSPKKGKDITSSSLGSNDKMSPSATCASVDLNVFLSDLLSLAVDHYHLKGSRSQRTFRNFYQEFRSSQYLCLDLGDDKVHPVDSETLARGVGDCSKVKATRTSNRGKGGADPEAVTSLNLNLGKVKHGSATLKKKATKNEVDGQGPLNLATGSAESSLGKRTANASGMPISEPTSRDPFEFSEDDSPKKRKSSGAALSVIPLNSRDPSGLPEGRQTESKKGKSSAGKIGKGSSGGTSQQKQKIEKALSECSAEIIITFSPGSALPTRDEVVSILSLYGDLIEPETELREDSCSIRVVFAKGRDAEKALNSPTKKTAFRSPLTGCRLRYLLETMPGPSVSQPVKKTPSTGPSVAHSVRKTPSTGPSVAQPVRKTPSPGPSVAQPVKKTAHPSCLVAQHFKKTPLPNIRKNLERLLRSLIGPFSVGQAAGTAEWMKLEGMEELAGDMKALLEKIDGILTQPPPAISH